MVKFYKECNLLETPDLLGVCILCHQTNTQGVMGSGIAKQFRDKYTVVYDEYVKFCKDKKGEYFGSTYKILGDVCFVEIDENLTVANLFGQNFYGRDRKYTSYDALEQALTKLKTWCYSKYRIKIETGEPIKIGFPDHMGCTLGGGNWKIVETIIDTVFENTDFEIYICKYEK